MENIDIDIDIDKDNLKNIDIDIDIDMAILENIHIDIDIDMEILQNIDIDKILYRLGFGISNTPIDIIFCRGNAIFCEAFIFGMALFVSNILDVKFNSSISEQVPPCLFRHIH